MKRLFIGSLTILSLLVCIVTAFFWGVGQRTRVNLVWASGREKYDIISDSSVVYWIQCHNWWCDVKPYMDSEPISQDLPIEKWVGMQDVTQSSFLGILHARGDWVSPFIHVTEDTVITNPKLDVKPGTMFYSITPFEAYGVPYWMIVCISAVLPMRFVIRKIVDRKQNRHRRQAAQRKVQ